MNLFKRIMQTVILIMTICIAFLGGIYISEYRQKQKANECTITTIAVINADAGVMVNGKLTNYAEELLTFPDVNFVMTGLQEAREGLKSNEFAAYILIPSTFSNSINSINQEPEKAQITYEINPNLREDIQIKVSDDIYNFLVNLNTNIAYVYVDAILQEVHSVQDDSNSIMENDITDMESINSINSDDLIQDVEYSELEMETVEIVYLDLASDFDTLQNTSDGICTTFETNMQTAQDDFEAILDSTDSIDTALLTVSDITGSVDILVNSDGEVVYESGIEHLDEYTEQFIDDTTNRKNDAKKALGWEEDDSSEETPLEEMKRQIDEQIVLLELILQDENVGLDTLANSSETVSGNENPDMNVDASKDEIQQVISNLETLKARLDTYYENGVAAIDAIPEASWVTEELQTIIDEEISQPILDECNIESQAVTDAVIALQGAVDGYATAVSEYDVSTYIEKEKIATDLATMQQIILDMQTEIIATDNSYIQYINELDMITNQNITALQDSLDLAYQLTQNNIDTAIMGLKTNREILNAQNVQLLGDIVQKLPYTRLGNLEYTQAYDFIVQPIIRENISEEKEIPLPIENGVNERTLVFLVLGISVLIGVYWSVLVIHKNNQIKNGKEEEA